MRSAKLPTMLPELAAVALIDAKTAAAVGSASESWWYQKVADGEAPQPATRGPRFTRWRATEVAEFWRGLANAGDAKLDSTTSALDDKACTAATAKRRPAAHRTKAAE